MNVIAASTYMNLKLNANLFDVKILFNMAHHYQTSNLDLLPRIACPPYSAKKIKPLLLSSVHPFYHQISQSILICREQEIAFRIKLHEKKSYRRSWSGINELLKYDCLIVKTVTYLRFCNMEFLHQLNKEDPVLCS
jgi:hypothetical protein